jgi:excisionase family DNA binding protein
LKAIGKNAESLKFGTDWPMFGHMEDQLYYSTGKAAQELGASQDAVRALCNGGVIRAVPTNGRQWRIPAREVERLKREGLPPVPRPMPGDGPVTRNASARQGMNGYHDGDADPHRAAGRERDVIQAYAGAARKHAMIEEREADWRLLELEDRFRAREDEMQTRHRKRESELQHADWLRAVEKAALELLDIKAPGAPPQMRLDLHKAVRERFAPLNPLPADQVAGELIRGTVQPFLDRHREQKEAEEIVKEARDSGLPSDARARPWDRELSQWQMKLLRTINERLSDRDDYPLDTIRTTVKEAVAEITREFQDRQAAERDRELRERVKASARHSIPFGLNDEGRKLAVQTIEEGIDRMPPGTSKDKLEAAADVALQPFRDAIRKHVEEKRRQQEEARLQEEEARRKRDAEETAARQKREAVEDQARKRSSAERRADSFADVSALYHLVAELDRKGDLDHGNFDENWALAQRLVKRIRPALVDLLMANPNLSDDKIKRQVELLVDRNLDSCLVGG